MKIKALIATLVLGSSSVALADSYGPTVRDHRKPILQPLPAPAPAPTPAPVQVAPVQYPYAVGWMRHVVRPMLLANDTRVAGRALINVSAGTRTFSKLELKAQNGRTDIQRVLITFANGQRQIVTLNGRRDGIVNQNKSLTIDLNGGARHIKSVMLIGTSNRRATIDVLAV